MADDYKEQSETEEPSSGGKPWLLIVAAAVIALMLGAGGAYFFLQSQQSGEPVEMDEEALAAAAEEKSAKAAEDNAAFSERVFSLAPFVVNVAGDGYSRYLKLKIDLEGENVLVKEELAAHLAQVRDAVIGLLSSKRLSDITDFEGKVLLKEDILLRVNDLLVQGKVNSVLFTEFVVQ